MKSSDWRLPATDDLSAVTMRIGTYNVYGLRGYPEAEAVEYIGKPESATAAAYFQAVFRELACDILALQEGVSHQQMQRIASALGADLATFPSPLHWPGHLLTCYPILESRILSQAPSWLRERPFSRMAGVALLAPSDHRLWVVNVHLHPSSPSLRAREAGLVRATAQALLRDTGHVIVLGDFNCTRDEPIHRALQELGFQDAMVVVGVGDQPTFNAIGQVGVTIDYVYLSAALRPALRQAAVVRARGFYADGLSQPGQWVHSDHLPVVVELAWP
jgi:endonuclease/exonuclease/phosphatase family metal-dependent hydrolase